VATPAGCWGTLLPLGGFSRWCALTVQPQCQLRRLVLEVVTRGELLDWQQKQLLFSQLVCHMEDAPWADGLLLPRRLELLG
jgi:hypothetical protein